MKDGVETDAIVELVGNLQSVPSLDARAIGRLTDEGVHDEVLLELVRKLDVRTGCDPVRAELLAAMGDVTAPEATAGSTGTGRIRVIAKSSLPVSYLEVLLDGDSVARKGQVQEGEAHPGWTLRQPLALDVQRGAIVFESELPVGRHGVQTVFAVSRVVSTDWDVAKRARGQRYETTKAGPAGKRGEIPVCEVLEGRTCVVVARLVKRGDGYAVAYDSKSSPWK
jgi:hypothetical protein